MRTTTPTIVAYASVAALCVQIACGTAFADDAKKPYYTEEPLYEFRPNPDQEEIFFGNVGVSGLLITFHKGVVATVDKTLPNTPADGKFKAGQIITGINGVKFIGRNPIPILGEALTTAEATDGGLVFDVKDNEQTPETKVKIAIPVLGSYGATWPLNSEKSKRIIHGAAEFYSTDKAFKKEFFAGKGIGGALACLFLLSTGDDKYLPCVKEYFSQFLPTVKNIGYDTWNNGYNGIACAEYYLRTGDKSVLPILQYYCDAAALNQLYGYGWNHGSLIPSPNYTQSGLQNAAGCQLLTTLLLARECGVTVDEKTLMGALRFFYRFVGHGTVPYGNHRAEGGLGSNGKDGMIAAAMQIASGTQGDPTIYKLARTHLGMSMLESYPIMVRGHGDEGRGDAIWRGIGSAYIRDVKPAMYYDAMNRLAWFYDLCRRPSGAFGMATCPEFDDPGSGAGVALAYTAPLKTLRITGAPASQYATKFTLPAYLWGNKADVAFLSIEKNPKYSSLGKTDLIEVPLYTFGSAYIKPVADPKDVPKQEMIKNVCHDSYMIRTYAAKALRKVGAFDELGTMLDDPDPRVRRAALDGMIDYNFWFWMGDDPLHQKDVSPRMVASLRRMLGDTNEAWWVVDGALMAMSLAPPSVIREGVPLIMPWLKHEEWWLRESAFRALLGLRADASLFPKVLPAMLEMVTKEYNIQPRERCLALLGPLLDANANPAGPQILAGLLNAVETTEIKPNRGPCRISAEDAYNVKATINTYLPKAPKTGLQTAEILLKRIASFDAMDIVSLIGSPNSNPEGRPQGFYASLDILNPEQRDRLATLLYTDYRLELVKRLKTTTDGREALLDTIVDLQRLRHPDMGWQMLGGTKPADQEWRYLSFNPLPNDALDRREGKRFRDVTLPQGLEHWYAPDFDDRAWKKGRAPIGVGEFSGSLDIYNPHGGDKLIANRSGWGDGEFLLMRTTFTLDDPHFDYVRIRALMKQGFRIYLNGHEIHSYIWWKDTPFYSPIILGPAQTALLKKGVNVLAAYSPVQYVESIVPRRRHIIKGDRVGQADVYLEVLNMKDITKYDSSALSSAPE